MTTHIVKTPEDWARLATLVSNLKPPLTISIVTGEHRSDRQNKLQRLWCREASEQLGDRTAEDVRAYCKLHYGVPMLREENADFREKYDRIIRPMPYETKLELMAEPMDFPVTRLMTKKQKTAYLDAMHKGLSEMGVRLTEPSE